jgi:hypothetical protein
MPNPYRRKPAPKGAEGYADIRAMHGDDYPAADDRPKRKRKKNQYRRNRQDRMEQTRPNTGSK